MAADSTRTDGPHRVPEDEGQVRQPGVPTGPWAESQVGSLRHVPVWHGESKSPILLHPCIDLLSTARFRTVRDILVNLTADG